MFKRMFRHGIVVSVIILAVSAGLRAQIDMDKRREAFQNQQRAASLNILRPTIKLIDDAPQRCELRFQILKFLFESKLTGYHDAAVSMATECLDDIAANDDQFSGADLRIKAGILALLRKHSPEIVKKIENKYFAHGRDTDPADEMDSDVRKNPDKAADKLMARIAGKGVSPAIGIIIDRIGETSPNASVRLLGAALAYWETHLADVYADNVFLLLESNYRDESAPLFLKTRYYGFLARLGEAAIADPQNKALTRVAIEVLKYALPDMQETSAEIYPKALSAYLALSSKNSKDEKDKEEIRKRIRESKDKLAQAISEASAIEDKNFKNEILHLAALYALDEKKHRLAAELELKQEYEGSSFKVSQSFFVIDSILNSCLKENDIEAAEYIVNMVEPPNKRSEGAFKIAAKLVKLKKMTEAFDKLNEGWQILAKTESAGERWWLTLQAIQAAVKIDKTRAFDMTGEFVKAVNGLPTPNAEDKPGTEARRKYVADVLMPVSYNLAEVFRLLGKEDFALADAIAQGIRRREWRTAAQIALETVRVYPLPDEPELQNPALRTKKRRHTKSTIVN